MTSTNGGFNVFDTVEFQGKTVRLGRYPRYSTILGSIDGLTPRRRALTWVLRYADEIYDAFEGAELAWVKQAEDVIPTPRSKKFTGFPVLVHMHIRKRHGMKALVHQACLELICHVDLFRSENSDVEIFARFIEEFYNVKDLRFMIRTRNAARTVLGKKLLWNDKQGQEAQLWLSHLQAVTIARAVLKDDATQLECLTAIEQNLYGKKPKLFAAIGVDPRKITVAKVIYLCLVCFTDRNKTMEEEQESDYGRVEDLSSSGDAWKVRSHVVDDNGSIFQTALPPSRRESIVQLPNPPSSAQQPPYPPVQEDLTHPHNNIAHTDTQNPHSKSYSSSSSIDSRGITNRKEDEAYSTTSVEDEGDTITYERRDKISPLPSSQGSPEKSLRLPAAGGPRRRSTIVANRNLSWLTGESYVAPVASSIDANLKENVITCIQRWENRYIRKFLPGVGWVKSVAPQLPLVMMRLREEVMRVITLQGKQLNLLSEGSDAHLLQEAVDTALVPLESVLQDTTTHAKVLHNLARALEQLNGSSGLREACVCWQEAITLDPMCVDALFSRGYALHQLGNVSAASACYSRVVEINPSYTKAWYNQGYLKADMDDQESAIRCFLRAAELNPSDSACQVHLGNAYKALGDDYSAAACYTKAMELDPQSLEAKYNMGALMQAQGNHEEAIASFSEVIEMDPLFTDAHFNLGLELLGAGQHKRASVCFDTVLSIDPDNAEAQSVLKSLI